MTYIELYENATRQLEKNEITLGEYEEMIKPLNREVIVTCKNCDHYEDMLVAIDKDGNKKILHVCKKYRKSVSEDWYCPDAERREA